jgi:hypothetical protein
MDLTDHLFHATEDIYSLLDDVQTKKKPSNKKDRILMGNSLQEKAEALLWPELYQSYSTLENFTIMFVDHCAQYNPLLTETSMEVQCAHMFAVFTCMQRHKHLYAQYPHLIIMCKEKMETFRADLWTYNRYRYSIFHNFFSLH